MRRKGPFEPWLHQRFRQRSAETGTRRPSHDSQVIASSQTSPVARALALAGRVDGFGWSSSSILAAGLAVTYLAFVALRLDPAVRIWLIAALVASVLRPSLAVVLTAVTLVPPELKLSADLPIGLYLTVAGAIGALARVVIRGMPVRIGWPIGALMAIGMITLTSLLWSLTREEPGPAAVHEWAILIAGVLACLIVISEPQAARRLPPIVFSLGMSVAVIGALAFVLPDLFRAFPLSWLIQPGEGGRPMGSTHGANILGLIAAMSFAYFAIQAIAERRAMQRVLMGGMAIACVPALYFTFSRSAGLGVAFAVLVGLLLMRRRIAVLAAAVVVVGALVFGGTLLANRLDTSSGVTGGHLDPAVIGAQATSDRLRVQAWLAGARMAIDKPVTGVGFGRYIVVREDYGGPRELGTPHSDYIRFFAETGVPGGLAFLLFLGGVAWSVRRTRDPTRAGLAAAIVAFCVATQFNAQLYYLEASLPFWVAIGAAIWQGQAGDEPRSDQADIDRGRSARGHAHPDVRSSADTYSGSA